MMMASSVLSDVGATGAVRGLLRCDALTNVGYSLLVCNMFNSFRVLSAGLQRAESGFATAVAAKPDARCRSRISRKYQRNDLTQLKSMICACNYRLTSCREGFVLAKKVIGVHRVDHDLHQAE